MCVAATILARHNVAPAPAPVFSMHPPGLDVEFRQPQPAPSRVARRALVLAGLACRGELEAHAADPAAQAIDATVRGWLTSTGLVEAFEAGERALFDPPLGALAPGLAAVARRSGEAAAVLAWGLGRYRLPAIDCAVEASEVGAALGWLDPGIGAAIEVARLRARTDQLLLAEALEVAHWRLASGRSASLVQFGAVRVAGDTAPLPLAPDGDLLLGGHPAGTAGAATVEAAMQRIHERRRALNWLAGQAADYAAVRVDL